MFAQDSNYSNNPDPNAELAPSTNTTSEEKSETPLEMVAEVVLTQVAGYLSSSASHSEIDAIASIGRTAWLSIANANLALALRASVTQS